MIESRVTALETRANGRVVFRSRLEARWSIYFDALGFKWKYEPFRYQLNDNGVTYTPDFMVDGIGLIEVKPTWESLSESVDRIAMFISLKPFERVCLFAGQGPIYAGVSILHGDPLEILRLDSMQTTLILAGKQRWDEAKANFALVYDAVRCALKKTDGKLDCDALRVGEVLTMGDYRGQQASSKEFRKQLLRKLEESKETAEIGGA